MAKIDTIRIWRGLRANLPALQDGELAYTEDTNQLYIGTSGGSNSLLVNPTGGLTSLIGDVTASGTGAGSATVVAVGGSTAAAIHTAVLATQAATNANTAGVIVSRDGSGNFAAGTITANLTGTASSATAPQTGSAHGAVTLDTSGHFQSVAPGASGGYLRSNGTDYVRSTIQAADVPAIPVTGISATGTAGSGTYLRGDGTWSTPGGTGTVTSASVVSANGFAGTVANATTTPAFTLTTSISGMVKGDGTALSSATSGTDYAPGTAALTTGILKSTTTTGVLSIAVAADFPTLNQNTSGSAASFTGNLSGDVTGAQGATTVGKINGVALSGLSTGILKNTTATGAPSIAIAADFPTLNQNTTGTAASLSGALSVTLGGSGVTSWTLGDTLYGSGSNTTAKLAGNTTTTNKFMTQTGTGTVSAAPGWHTIAAADLPAPFTSATASGNTSKFATTSGALTSGHVASFDASGNIVDGGTPLTNPMTTAGDLIYGGASGAATRLANGSVRQILTSAGGTSAPSWSGPMGAVQSKSAAYTVLSTDGFLIGNATSAAFTFTLPSGSTVSGIPFWFKKSDSDATFNAITITDGSFSTTVNTTGELVLIMYTGAAYEVLDRRIPGVTTGYTPTYTGMGTVTGSSVTYRRQGEYLEIQGTFTTGTPTAVLTSLTLPSGLNLDSSKLSGSSTNQIVGQGAEFKSATTGYFAVASPSNSTTGIYFGYSGSSNGPANGSALWDATTQQSFWARVPISGWKG